MSGSDDDEIKYLKTTHEVEYVPSGEVEWIKDKPSEVVYVGTKFHGGKRMFKPRHAPSDIDAGLGQLGAPKVKRSREASTSQISSKKKQKTNDSPGPASSTASSSKHPVKAETPFKREDRSYTYITDSDDDLPIEIQDPKIAAEEKRQEEMRLEVERKVKIEEDEAYEEEGYQAMLPGISVELVKLDRYEEEPVPEDPVKYERDIPKIEPTNEVFHAITTSDDGIFLAAKPHGNFIRPTGQRSRLTRHEPKTRRSRYLPPSNLPVPVRSCQTAGAVNRIIQCNGAVAVATSVIKGGPDEHDQLEHFYITSGSLCVYQVEATQTSIDRPIRPIAVSEHKSIRTSFKRTLRKDDSTQYSAVIEVDAQEIDERKIGPSDYAWTPYQYEKLYTVNSLAYDIRSDIIASSSTDKTIRFTPMQSDAPVLGYNCPTSALKFKHGVPHELVFNSASQTRSILAVGGRQIVLYYDLFADDVNSDEEDLRFARTKSAQHVVGSLCWGRGPTSDQLFASTESVGAGVGGTGKHKMFTPASGAITESLEFDATGSGDEMAVSPDGCNLALITASNSTERTLRIYDIANKNRKSIMTATLVPFDAHYKEPQVNAVVYSPFTPYLMAIARSDNSVHVYDSRRLDQVYQKFTHRGPSKVFGGTDNAYGVVQAEWVSLNHADRRGLVTGGEDGFVRLWDPIFPEDDRDNGLPIAEIESDVARFSIGDWTKQEHNLIIGGSDGKLSFFNKLPYFYKISEDAYY